MNPAQTLIRMLLQKIPSLLGSPKISFEIEINKVTVASLLQIPVDKFEMSGLDKISVLIHPIEGHVFLEITHLGVVGGLPDGYLLKPEELVKIVQDRGLDPRGIDVSGTVVKDGFVYMRLIHPQQVMCASTAEELQAALDTMHAKPVETETAAERSCKQMETLLKVEVERLRAEGKTAMEVETETQYLRQRIEALRNSKPPEAREDRGAPLHGSRGDLLFDEALGLCEKFLEGKERTTIEALFGTTEIPARAKMMTCDKRVAGGPAVGGTYYAAAEYALIQNGFVIQKDGTWLRVEKREEKVEPVAVEHDRPVFVPEPGHMAEVIEFPQDKLREL